jgi:hypothetical protein
LRYLWVVLPFYYTQLFATLLLEAQKLIFIRTFFTRYAGFSYGSTACHSYASNVAHPNKEATGTSANVKNYSFQNMLKEMSIECAAAIVGTFVSLPFLGDKQRHYYQEVACHFFFLRSCQRPFRSVLFRRQSQRRHDDLSLVAS